jgi:antitoxin ParD1/3/4
MVIALTPDLEEFVQSKIRNGTYRDVNEVIQAGLRLLREREERLQALREEISAGLEQAERGDVAALDEALIEQIKQLGRQRQQR